MHASTKLTDVIGDFPYRVALAGGWIDQPFMSRHHPNPPGSMVVVGVEPTFFWMERAGIATGTRKIALQLWGRLPEGDPGKLVDELYGTENEGKAEPSGSQDMIGLIYPGVNRLDYDINHRGGIVPCHIESNNDPQVARWLEQVIQVLPVAPRPPGYSPLGIKNLDVEWVCRLAQAGKDCYNGIVNRDLLKLAASMNETMLCWATMLPHVIAHPTITTDLAGILKYYQSRYPGAMYSGCGGGYLFVASEEPVPGAFKFKIRIGSMLK